ncbi:alpha/beta hydrolase [Nocardiopsis ganjiahuensis]|uniref:alpha/beta hydrolase n=1 Tax=Nocardiopsis ganjiahuensis TaxID=239984 RepID=UPI00034D3BB9|nr:alpha/beta hydrolase [Nocardiopsis ganjiahuensis]
MVAAGPSTISDTDPLRYERTVEYGVRLLACDGTEDGRIVEELGDAATADHVAVLVPGNDNYLGNYFNQKRATRPRANAETLLNTMREVAPGERVAVVVWVGYRTPRGFGEAVSRRPAMDGARDLARLTRFLPSSARVTLVGHSYGTVVCGLALEQGRVSDCVALGSPGMGTRTRQELGFEGNLWAALGPSDWIRFFPRGHVGEVGHGPSPMRRGYGARVFETGDIPGHCSYYLQGSESVRNIARIALGRYDEVTPVTVPVPRRVRSEQVREVALS